MEPCLMKESLEDYTRVMRGRYARRTSKRKNKEKIRVCPFIKRMQTTARKIRVCPFIRKRLPLPLNQL